MFLRISQKIFWTVLLPPELGGRLICGSENLPSTIAAVYKMADGADGKSQMYVLFCYFA